MPHATLAIRTSPSPSLVTTPPPPDLSLQLFMEKFTVNDKVLQLGYEKKNDLDHLLDCGLHTLVVEQSADRVLLIKTQSMTTEVQKSKFQEMRIEPDYFDGVWARDSLSQIPKADLPSVLNNINEALREGGHFFISVQKGTFDGIDGRTHQHLACYDENEIMQFLKEAGFIIESYSGVTDGTIEILCKK